MREFAGDLYPDRVRKLAGLLVGGLLGLLTGAEPARGAISEAGFSEAAFVSSADLGGATGLAWAPDGSNRLFVTLKQGPIRIIKNGTLLPTPFATLSPLHALNECGVIGIAFDPNFLANGYVYAFVTVSSSEQQIIRYTAAGDVGIDKTPVVTGLPTRGGNHDGGGIGFGPDGKLYWSIGDLGDGTGVDGDLASLAAKVGRANLDGTAPDDNPFFDGAGPNADHIWARGFRNPFTLAFQPATGLLWLNVVGNIYEQIFIVRRGDNGGWNNYENDQPSGFITPIIKYRTNISDPKTLRAAGMNGAVRAGGTATFSTTAAHGFRLGEKITISGVTDSSFDGALFVAGVPSTTTFTAPQAGADASSGGGMASPLNQGGAVTGGAFYEATQFPAAYRGNFFYSDYGAGRIMRAAINPTTNVVTSVDYFASGIPGIVDVAVGPDGALYYVGVTSNGVYRGTYNAALQGLVVSPAVLWMTEGQSAMFSVRLQVAPPSDVTVSVTHAGGDADIAVGAGSSLTFTAANWNVPQTVTIAAMSDADTTDDVATLSVSSAALTAQTIPVQARDIGAVGLVLSQAALTINEGASGTFTVALSSAPSANVTVAVARSAGDDSVTVTGGASLTFTTANWGQAQTVTVGAAEDADAADDSATVTITASGLSARTVAVTARDNDAAAPVITSTAIIAAVAGVAYRYDVEATGLPAPTFSLDSTVAGMTIAGTTGVISWTPAAAGGFPVTVRAANGVVPDATQTFTITVAADQPPTCLLTRPTANEVVSGATAEFYGDGMDDVGTVRAEFYVDGQLRSTDVGTSGHYHFGGTHNLWNTTALADGAHTARMVVVDTAGQTCAREVTITSVNGAPADAAADGGVAEVAVDVAQEAIAEVNPPADAPSDPITGIEAPQPIDGGVVEVAANDAARDVVAAMDVEPSGPADADEEMLDSSVARDVGSSSDSRPDTRLDAPADRRVTAKKTDSGCGCDVGDGGPTRASLGALLTIAGLFAGRRRGRGRKR